MAAVGDIPGKESFRSLDAGSFFAFVHVPKLRMYIEKLG